jgi:hypothetical protein
LPTDGKDGSRKKEEANRTGFDPCRLVRQVKEFAG